jgi:hypothetical protein
MGGVAGGVALGVALAVAVGGCAKPAGAVGGAGGASALAVDAGAAAVAVDAGAAAVAVEPAADEEAAACGAMRCRRFASDAEAFRWILAREPAILAVGEAHAQRGTEAVASATRRFTESMLPLLEGRASELLVEAWAGDPRCATEVKQVATAHRPVTQAQAPSNPSEYEALGQRAKALGVQPYLLRPSCADYASLADAGADVVGASLGLVKRLTQADATRWFERNQAAGSGKVVVTYGGAMHNDLAPSAALAPYSFGPELEAVTGRRYVELDLIVPEYVKRTEVWEKLPWFAAFQADPGPRDRPTVYQVGERSFALVFARSGPAPAAAAPR